MSWALRHAPGEAGVTLDAQGWTDVDALAAALGASHDAILDVVETSDKQRFALSPDGLRIRASQGHTVPVDLGLTPVPPPSRLYHGTVARFLDAIGREGLRPLGRHHVHLSASRAEAEAVGRRRGPPVTLAVAADAMAAAGHVFYRSANGVWLTDVVPPEHIEILE